MAKKATNKKENLPMEEVLWKACDALLLMKVLMQKIISYY